MNSSRIRAGRRDFPDAVMGLIAAGSFPGAMMMCGIKFHYACRENHNPAAGVVIVLPAAFLLYGRVALAPL